MASLLVSTYSTSMSWVVAAPPKSAFCARAFSSVSHHKILSQSQLGFSLRSCVNPMETKGGRRRRRRVRRRGGMVGVVRASLFGVGAPEALVIGVVALLVFGPKGLAEVARNLGKTLRTFQPTIKELQEPFLLNKEVSREFKTTLEREIGLDDISNQTLNTYNPNTPDMPSTPSSTASVQNPSTVADPNGTPSSNRAYTSDEYLKITEEQLKSSAVPKLRQSAPPGESQLEPQAQPDMPAMSEETAAQVPLQQKPEHEL
ncbi:hypothetical protein Tsubulata_025336 [Turnera subulata]|uniref:Sec-independent protein translocase protein TATB, chloroplastic n=1 Tax=Turnera subulata TaxID=218843 RepID=A0A9Q0FE39_9ROSI|nr:hypothetical protein Tsubulata_025336 [Turnera subulata]